MIKTRYEGDFCQETNEWSAAYKGALNKFPVMDLDHRLREVEKRLLIIAPDNDVLAKYPALAKAYEEYKIIEKLTIGND